MTEKLNPKYSSASPGLKDTDRQYVESYVKPVLDRCEEYIKYKNDAEYKDVAFDWNTNGLKAWHKDHKTHPNDTKTYNINGEILKADDLEQRFFDRAFKNGHKVIFKKEDNNLTDLDMYFDDVLMDLASITKDATTFKNPIKRKQLQINDYKALYGTDVDAICLYFHKPEWFSEQKIKDVIEKLKSYGMTITIKKVYVILNREKDDFFILDIQ